MATQIEVRNVFKKYGKKTALSGVSLVFEKGKIYGVLGPNGMGKTTLLKIVVGVLKPTSGNVYIDGEFVNRDTKKLISFSPEDKGLYENMRVYEFLEFVAHMSSGWSKNREKKLLRMLDIPAQEKIENLSRGFKARLRVLTALSKEAEFYFLDEPLSGIDPTSRHRIRETIRENFSHNACFVITSHLIGEIEHLFDFVYFIDRGEIVLSGKADDLRNQHNTTIEGIYINTFR